MSAIPESFLKTAALSTEVTQPFPNSRKIYITGSRPDLKVGMREIHQTPTSASFGFEENPPIPCTTPHGPFTDPAVQVNLLEGIPDVRLNWILERNDTEQLSAPSSEYGLARQSDPKLAHLRFAH